MSDLLLNCLGMTCPQPVMECHKAISQQSPARITVLVGDAAALENVTRFLAANGYETSSAAQETGWAVFANRVAAPQTPPDVADYPCPAPASAHGGKTLVFLTTATLGQGDDGLGDKLMGNFLKTLPELEDELWRIVMVNGAVRLSAKDSPHVQALKTLEAAGVSILVCGTCLDFFGLLADKAVGQTTNMLDVVTSMQVASKIITI